jgi:hypothetical protein
MKKKEKKRKHFAIRKNVYFYCSFWATPLALHFKDDFVKLEKVLV